MGKNPSIKGLDKEHQAMARELFREAERTIKMCEHGQRGDRSFLCSLPSESFGSIIKYTIDNCIGLPDAADEDFLTRMVFEKISLIKAEKIKRYEAKMAMRRD